MRDDAVRWSMCVLAGALALGCGGSAPASGPDVGTSDAGRDAGAPLIDAGNDASPTSDAGHDASTVDAFASDAGDDAGSDGGMPWPTCDVAPPGALTATLHDIWVANPTTPTAYFVHDVIVTGISGAGCTAGTACTIFLQSAETFASLAAGSQQSIMMFVSPNTASHFTTVAVGDRVDASGYAWRYNLGGRNDLLLQVNLQLPGCTRTTGTASPTPVDVLLSDLTRDAYENTVGPLLVRVQSVSGRPAMPFETFGLLTTGVFSADAGVENIVSLSPTLLTGSVFTGLTSGVIHDFASVTGVFGIFVPATGGTTYLELYPRSAAEYPITWVH